MVTGLKLQSPETNSEEEEEEEEGVGGGGVGGLLLIGCPSLTEAAGRTQSARCSDIKEAAAEALSPKSCSLGAGGFPAPRLKA